MYAVILAGGGGTRLWPLSTPDRPKPFLPLLGQRTLLQLTADRLADLVEADAIYVVTDRRYADLVHDQLPGAQLIEEPMGRNTAAAVALATVAIDRPDDEVMAILPAAPRGRQRHPAEFAAPVGPQCAIRRNRNRNRVDAQHRGSYDPPIAGPGEAPPLESRMPA